DTNKRREYDCWLREQQYRKEKGTVAERIEICYEETDSISEPCRCGDYYNITSEEIQKIVDIGIFECASCSLCLEVSKTALDNSSQMLSTKIVVVGESGVGKTSFVNALCGNPSADSSSTIGASIAMVWHEYKAGTSEQRSELMELWDIGGSGAHRAASVVFLDGAAGAILVHDLSNKKSEE
ncbi:hypothetical protein TELCIR_19349, partial [Teladorsagia circumcincta]